MSELTLRRSGAALAGVVGLLHLILAPEYLDEQPYVGVLFLIGGVTLLAAAVGIWQRSAPAAWLLAAATSAGMLLGGIASRTVGLPGFKESDWELSLVLSLVLEAALLAISIRPLQRFAEGRRGVPTTTRQVTPAASG